MYNITDIKMQNQQDCWSVLYMHLSKSMLEICGRGAEGGVRNAIRLMAEDWGQEVREKHLRANLKTNLASLYGAGFEYITDPRMLECSIQESAEVYLWEVHTCPMADLWNKAGASALGLWYCEEFQRGWVAGYTNGKGQINLSKSLTCPRDNHCRFSIYYRSANTNGEQRKQSFPYSGEKECNQQTLQHEGFAEGIKVQFIKTCYYTLQVANERFKNEGICAITLGLRNAADALAPMLRLWAEHTLNRCDESFLRENFPINFDTALDSLWLKYKKNDVARLIQVNLLDRLSRQLGLQQIVR